MQSAQFERVAVLRLTFLRMRQRMRDRGAGHFQTRGGRERAYAAAVAFVLDEMEGIFAESRVVALTGEVGRVDMQQRMQCRRVACGRRDAGIGKRIDTDIQPMTFLGEGITRQSETLRRVVDCGETIPRQIEALDPQIGQSRQFATRDPLGDDAAEIRIGRQRGEGVAVGADLAAIMTLARRGAFDAALLRIGPVKIRRCSAQLDLQFCHAAGQNRQTLVHRLASGLQGVGDVV